MKSVLLLRTDITLERRDAVARQLAAASIGAISQFKQLLNDPQEILGVVIRCRRSSKGNVTEQAHGRRAARQCS